jgi:uncharacterized protein YeaO (DUF488 family)
MPLRRKRVYEEPSPEDGVRLLVDRLWPRGLTRERACVDEWLKEVAPSDGLRRWIHRDMSRWDEFAQRYRAELAERREALEEIRRMARQGTVTLVYGTKDPERNHAAILMEVLESATEKGDGHTGVAMP